VVGTGRGVVLALHLAHPAQDGRRTEAAWGRVAASKRRAWRIVRAGVSPPLPPKAGQKVVGLQGHSQTVLPPRQRRAWS